MTYAYLMNITPTRVIDPFIFVSCWFACGQDRPLTRNTDVCLSVQLSSKPYQPCFSHKLTVSYPKVFLEPHINVCLQTTGLLNRDVDRRSSSLGVNGCVFRFRVLTIVLTLFFYNYYFLFILFFLFFRWRGSYAATSEVRLDVKVCLVLRHMNYKKLAELYNRIYEVLK